jgi:hypothetical protein
MISTIATATGLDPTALGRTGYRRFRYSFRVIRCWSVVKLFLERVIELI